MFQHAASIIIDTLLNTDDHDCTVHMDLNPIRAFGTVKGTDEFSTIYIWEDVDGGITFTINADGRRQRFQNTVIPSMLNDETILAHAQYASTWMQKVFPID